MKRFELLRRYSRPTAFRVRTLQPLGYISKKYRMIFSIGKMQENHARTKQKMNIWTLKNSDKCRKTGGRNYQSGVRFRVSHLRPLGQLSVCILNCRFLIRKWFGENYRREQEKIFDLMFRNPDESRVLCGRNRLSYGEFRVSPVMTTSIRLQIWTSVLYQQAVEKSRFLCFICGCDPILFVISWR